MSEGRVYGRNPVLALLRQGGRRADEIAVLSGAHGPLAEVVALARRAGVKVSYRTREQLTAIARYTLHREPSNVVGVHIYTFGGVVKTAAWMRELM